jgi:hypothetical protein
MPPQNCGAQTVAISGFDPTQVLIVPKASLEANLGMGYLMQYKTGKFTL